MSTADKIMDVAEELIMTRGYNAFSYHDIAPRLGIKAASIHYHFPKKSQLGIEVVRRYTDRVVQVQQATDTDEAADELDKLERYMGIFLGVSEQRVKICLCGALAGEFISLPDDLRHEVLRFFDVHETWLAKLLGRGRKRGHFAFEGSAPKMAKLVFSALEGALLISRSREDPRAFTDAVATIKQLLGTQ